MDFYEAYSFLLADVFMASIVLPIKSSLAFPVMKIFGGYNIFLMVIIATVGAVGAACFNWLLGKMLVTAVKYQPQGEAAQKTYNILTKYGKWLLLLAWVPVFGPLIVTLSGAARIAFLKVIPIVITVNIIYYSVAGFINT